jgi:Xaa-Pro aminopeptidase
VTTDTLLQPTVTADEAKLASISDRRLDIETKMGMVGTLLQGIGCEGLLLMEPENYAWLTSGAVDRGRPDPGSAAALYCTADQRWLLASNADCQRIFDEELDGLGFQLKEWPWHWDRDRFVADLLQNRRVACDRPFPNTQQVAERLPALRRKLTAYEQACYAAAGQVVAHALEATCRTFAVNETEREVAGQVSHRLLHRGALPLHIGVAADSRSRHYPNHGFTSTPIRKYALVTATARKYGLTVTTSRAVSFGPLDEQIRKEQNAVCRVSASYLASTWPDAVPREILLAGQRIYLLSGFEHEWRLSPQGHITGRLPVELQLTPTTEVLFHPGWAVTWIASAGAASSCDTYLITDQGPKTLTPAELWPLKRIKIQGAEFVRPDVLQR